MPVWKLCGLGTSHPFTQDLCDHFAHFRRARRGVRGQRDFAQKHLHLARDAVRDRRVRDGKRRGVRRVRVYHRRDIRPLAVDRQV